MGRLEAWDRRNQRRAERDQELFGGDDWAERMDQAQAERGPAWAQEDLPGWSLPLLALIFVFVSVVVIGIAGAVGLPARLILVLTVPLWMAGVGWVVRLILDTRD